MIYCIYVSVLFAPIGVSRFSCGSGAPRSGSRLRFSFVVGILLILLFLVRLAIPGLSLLEPVDFGLPAQGCVGPWGIVVLSRGDPVDPGPGVARGPDIPQLALPWRTGSVPPGGYSITISIILADA